MKIILLMLLGSAAIADECFIVEGKGALQKRASGEGHQAQAIRCGNLAQIQRRQLGAFQPVRRKVTGQHALGSINRHYQIQAVGTRLLPRKTELRPSHHQPEQGNGAAEQHELQLLAPGRYARGQDRS